MAEKPKGAPDSSAPTDESETTNSGVAETSEPEEKDKPAAEKPKGAKNTPGAGAAPAGPLAPKTVVLLREVWIDGVLCPPGHKLPATHEIVTRALLPPGSGTSDPMVEPEEIWNRRQELLAAQKKAEEEFAAAKRELAGE